MACVEVLHTIVLHWQRSPVPSFGQEREQIAAALRIAAAQVPSLLAQIAQKFDDFQAFKAVLAGLTMIKRQKVLVEEAMSAGIGKIVPRLQDNSKVAQAGSELLSTLQKHYQQSCPEKFCFC